LSDSLAARFRQDLEPIEAGLTGVAPCIYMGDTGDPDGLAVEKGDHPAATVLLPEVEPSVDIVDAWIFQRGLGD
jgi:hypothetical protein